MARDVYSLRIFATASLTSSSGVVGPIVPTGFVYVLRDIDVVEVSFSGSKVVQVNAQTLGVLWVFESGSTLATQVGQWRGRQVYNEGEQVAFQASSGTWSIAASGYQLTLP